MAPGNRRAEAWAGAQLGPNGWFQGEQRQSAHPKHILQMFDVQNYDNKLSDKRLKAGA